MAKYVLKYEIYKGKGAVQFRLAPAYSISSGNGPKPKGCVFVEAAPATGERKYGFQSDGKITMALNVTDIGQMLLGFRRGAFSLVHDPHAQTEQAGQIAKRMELWAGKAMGNTQTYMLKLTENNGNKKKQVIIPLETSELIILTELLKTAIPRILNWT